MRDRIGNLAYFEMADVYKLGYIVWIFYSPNLDWECKAS